MIGAWWVLYVTLSWIVSALLFAVPAIAFIRPAPFRVRLRRAVEGFGCVVVLALGLIVWKIFADAHVAHEHWLRRRRAAGSWGQKHYPIGSADRLGTLVFQAAENGRTKRFISAPPTRGNGMME